MSSFQEGFWETIHPFLFGEEKIISAKNEIQSVINYTNKQKGTVLDACCGMGRHSNEFSKLGFKTLGVDSSQHLINHARKTYQNNNLEFIYVNFLEFNEETKFDIVCCLWNSFGFENDRNSNDLFFSKLCRFVESKGNIVISFATEEVITNRFSTSSVKKKNGVIQEKYKKLDSDERTFETRWVFKKNGLVSKEYITKQHLYSINEIYSYLEKKGFHQISHFGSYNLDKYDEHSHQVVFFAIKK